MDRLRSIGTAFKGAFLLLKTETSIQIQAVIAVLVIIAGFYFEISTTEWLFQIAAITIVMSLEGMNTALEKLADFVHPEFHSDIGWIKDVSAGAVLFAAIGALVIGVLIYYPKLF